LHLNGALTSITLHKFNKKLFALLVDDIALDRLPGGLAAQWQVVRLRGEPAERFVTAHLFVLSPDDLRRQACKLLAGLIPLRRDEMRLAGYPDSMPSVRRRGPLGGSSSGGLAVKPSWLVQTNSFPMLRQQAASLMGTRPHDRGLPEITE
jgi:hypothetical protein